ncbi:MAG TPA: RHS repeat-associated core domain-containing protein, partial [Povalibacter sp.]|nr:RHS repeat-associated core domain-containing protein [Povalibacter sp.]
YDSEGYESYSALELHDLHTDHLNTPVAATRSADGVIVWCSGEYPFGAVGYYNCTQQVNYSIRVEITYPGQIYDYSFGRRYNYFREYDPYTGRYLQSDPIGLRGGTNTFSYAAQRPTMAVDPYGLSEADVNAILNHLRSNFPEINPRGGWDFNEPEHGHFSDTSPFSGQMHFGKKYAVECLTLKEFTELYSNVLHESMHSTDNMLVRLNDSIHGDSSSTVNHSAIQNREDFEMDRLPRYGPNLIYQWPMWNIPYDPNFNRKPIDGQIQELYQNTRPETCGCKKE